jgi:CRISPR/Cas system-associated protein endoribonuclease Cas2
MRIVTGNEMGNKMEDELGMHAAHKGQVRNLYRSAARLERMRLLVGPV